MSEDENNHENAAPPPEETKVSCFNYISRWIGCFDITENGEGPPNLREGVLESRLCTDVPWFILALGFSLFCYLYVWEEVLAEGDWERFMGASDYMLNTCGRGNMTDKPWGAWPDLKEFDVKICVHSCEDTATSTSGAFMGGYESYEALLWCVPEVVDDDLYADWLSAWSDYEIFTYILDMEGSYEIPLYSIPLTFMYLFVFFFFVRCFLKLLIKFLFAGLFIATIVGSYEFLSAPRSDEASYYTGIAVMCLGIIFWCMVMCWWNSLMEVLDVLAEASKAMMVMPQMLLTPFLTLPILVFVLGFWYIIVLLMYTVNDTEQLALPSTDSIDNTIAVFYSDIEGVQTEWLLERNYDYSMNYKAIVHFFWMMWGVVFVEYLNFVIISMCVSDWFMDRQLVDNPEAMQEYKKGCCGGNFMRLFKAMYRTFRYHLGTILFASALIAAIRTLEAVLMYLQQQFSNSTNPFAEMAMKCLVAIVACLDCIVDRCNKNTLVVTAVLGSPFCGGCGEALKLFFGDLGLMATGSGMIAFLCLISNVLIALLSAGSAALLFVNGNDEDELMSVAFPIICAFLASFFLTKLLLGVWDSAATSILVCTAMLKKWYPEEYKKNLVSKAEKIEKDVVVDVNDVELNQVDEV